MARVGGRNGALSFVSGHNADFASWRLRASQGIDDDTSYADAGSGSSHAGSGTIDYELSFAGFLRSRVADSAPGLDDITASGGAVTMTSDSGCTHAGTFIVSSLEIDHARRRGAIPIAGTAVNDGSVTETWAVA